MLTYDIYSIFNVIYSFELSRSYISSTMSGHTKLSDFYDCIFFMATYRQMCMSETYTVDIYNTIRLHARLHHLVETLPFCAVSTPVHLPHAAREVHHEYTTDYLVMVMMAKRFC